MPDVKKPKDEASTSSSKQKTAKNAVQSTLSINEQTQELYSEEKTPAKKDSWVNWIDRNDGSQYIVLRILNWNIDWWHYDDRDWDSRPYHETDKGKLAVSSVGLRRLLKPYLESDYQGKLKIQRTGKGTDTEYSVTDYKEFGD